jgi:hypothetical protein
LALAHFYVGIALLFASLPEICREDIVSGILIVIQGGKVVIVFNLAI